MIRSPLTLKICVSSTLAGGKIFHQATNKQTMLTHFFFSTTSTRSSPASPPMPTSTLRIQPQPGFETRPWYVFNFNFFYRTNLYCRLRVRPQWQQPQQPHCRSSSNVQQRTMPPPPNHHHHPSNHHHRPSNHQNGGSSSRSRRDSRRVEGTRHVSSPLVCFFFLKKNLFTILCVGLCVRPPPPPFKPPKRRRLQLQ